MDWIESLQKAIDYIEENLLEDIDAESIAESVYTSNTHFQRIFRIITGMTISEYIRSRRLSLAGQELFSRDIKVIDIAIKYGYDTPESFTKAFTRFHGITPSAARKFQYQLKSFDPLSIQISIRGGFNVAKIEMDYILVERPSFKVVGRRRITPQGGGTWGVAREDGSVRKLEALETGKPFLGVCFGFGADGSNDYMVGMELEEDMEGLESYTYPKHAWLIYELAGSVSEDVLGNAWWYVKNELLPKSGYKIDCLPTIESYIEWNNEQDRCKVEIHIPYVKA
jgi:AraC family transcriptional regulator